MKKLFIPALLALSSLLTFRCGGDTPDQNNGQWVVSYFLDIGDKDEDTGLFAGYSFDFNDNNEWVVYLPGGNSSTGKWLIYDNGGTLASFGMENPFAPVEVILGDWDVVEQTDTGLKLKGRLDFTSANEESILHFQKQ